MTVMRIKRSRGKNLLPCIAIVALLAVSPCARKFQTHSQLPQDIFGISVGMIKEEAENRLKEIAVFEGDERKRQQIWRLNNDPQFSKVAIGYDLDRRVRYVTVFVDVATAKKRIRFTDVGDISKAKAEIVAPHYRYIWDAPSINGKPDYFVTIYGDNPEYVTTYSLSGKAAVPDS
jgi:hypothetical protein